MILEKVGIFGEPRRGCLLTFFCVPGMNIPTRKNDEAFVGGDVGLDGPRQGSGQGKMEDEEEVDASFGYQSTAKEEINRK